MKNLFKYEKTIAFFVPLFSLITLQTAEWIYRNGLVYFGSCVNHFGEVLKCSFSDSLGKLLSPFALPAVLIIWVLAFVITLRLLKFANKRLLLKASPSGKK